MLMRSAFTGETAAREPPDPRDPRVTGLRRMRILATLLLVAMTVVFIAASFAEARWPWLAYVRAFSEAGMVGACADWFAVAVPPPARDPDPPHRDRAAEQGAHRRRHGALHHQ